MKWKLFLLFLGVAFYSTAQRNFRVGISGQLGIGVLQTSYDDDNPIGSNLPVDRESIFSKPRIVYGIGGQADYIFSDICTLNGHISVLKNGYQYKIRNYLDQGTVKATYNRWELGIGLGMKAFIFSKEREFTPVKKRYKKRGKRKRKLEQLKRRQNRESIVAPYVYVGYEVGIQLSESYNYADIDDLTDLASERNEALHGYRVGFGLKREKMDFLVSFHSDVQDFIKDDERHDYHLKDISVTVSYWFSE